MEVEELLLPSGMSQLNLCEEEEEEGKLKPSTPKYPGALPPALKEAAGCVIAVGFHPEGARSPLPDCPVSPSAPGKGGDATSSVPQAHGFPHALHKKLPTSLSPSPPQWPYVSRYLSRSLMVMLN